MKRMLQLLFLVLVVQFQVLALVPKSQLLWEVFLQWRLAL
jgi:hypothetical protein